jgi:hypothetical protein
MVSTNKNTFTVVAVLLINLPINSLLYMKPLGVLLTYLVLATLHGT